MSASYLSTATVIPIAEVGRARRKVRSTPKGRAVDPKALAEVQALLGDSPRRRDLLIEFLHRVQDTFGHIAAAHIVALAQEMRLSMTEVYEVATFYHHFDVVKEGESAPPPITVRVCETLSCRMAGADELRTALAGLDAGAVRVIGAPCIGRCEHAPAAVVGRNPIDAASAEKIAAAIEAGRIEPVLPAYVELDAYRGAGGYRTLKACVDGERSVEAVIAELENSALRGLGGAGFAARRRRVHLRRGIGDDRIDRGQARHAAPSPPVRRTGRSVRPADARTQHGNPVLGARHPGEGCHVVRESGSARAQGPALLLGLRTCGQARRSSRPRWHQRARADRRVLRRHAPGSRVLCLPSRRCIGRNPSRI